MKRIRIMSIVLVFSLLFTMFPYQAIEGGQVGIIALPGADSTAEKYVLKVTYGGETVSEVKKISWKENDKEEIAQSGNGEFEVSLKNSPDRYNFRIIDPDGKYIETSCKMVEQHIYSIEVKKRIEFSFKDKNDTLTKVDKVTFNKTELELDGSKYYTYLSADQINDVDLSVDKKGYYNKYNVKTLKDENTIDLKPISKYMETDSTVTGEELFGVGSDTGYTLEVTGKAKKKGNKIVADSQAGYARAALLDSKGVEKDVKYLYVYEPLTLGDIKGNHIGDGTSDNPCIPGVFDGDNTECYNYIELPSIKGGNKDWTKATYECDIIKDSEGNTALDNCILEGNTLKIDDGYGDVRVRAYQTDLEGKKRASAWFYIRFCKKIENTSYDANEFKKEKTRVITQKTDLQIAYKPTKGNTKFMWYGIAGYNMQYAEVNQANGTLKLNKVTEPGKPIKVYVYRIYDWGCFEILSYNLNIVREQKDSVKFARNEVSIDTTNWDETEDCAFIQKPQENQIEDDREITYEFEYYDTDENKFVAVDKELELSKGDKYNGEFEDSKETGAIYAIKKAGTYRVTAKREKTDVVEESKDSYILQIKKAEQNKLQFEHGTVYEATYGQGEIKNELIGYNVPRTEEPEFEYKKISGDDTVGTFNENTGTFTPSREIGKEDNSKVVIGVRLKETDTYQGSDWLEYTIYLSYSEIGKDKYLMDLPNLKGWYNKAIKIAVNPELNYELKTLKSSYSHSDEQFHKESYIDKIGVYNHTIWFRNDDNDFLGKLNQTIKYDPIAPELSTKVKNNTLDKAIERDKKDYKDSCNDKDKLGKIYLSKDSTIGFYSDDEYKKEETSGVVGTYYHIEEIGESINHVKTPEELDDETDWVEFKSKDKLTSAIGDFGNTPERFVMYIKTIDNADNVSYVSSPAIVRDEINPTVALKTENGKKLFNKSTDIEIDANDNVGIKKITYQVEGEEEKTIEGNGKKSIDGKIRVDKELNKNDIKIVVEVTDMAGNTAKTTTKVSIDTVAPVGSLTYGGSSRVNEKYYTENCTALLTFAERNFDPENVSIRITSPDGAKCPTIDSKAWKNPGGFDKDDTKNTLQINFTNDGEYQITIECKDKAGNKAERITDNFVIDTKNPATSVSCNNNNVANGNFYKAPRTFNFDVLEHNFDQAKAVFKATGEGGALSEWKKNGDHYTASVTFSENGKHSWTYDVTDKAARKGQSLSEKEFIIDTVVPKLDITGVGNGTAYTDKDVRFKVNASDEYIDKLTVSLSYQKNGKNGLETVSVPCTPQISDKSAAFESDNLKDDGVYTLHCEVSDKAGNVEKKTIMFSINRQGPTFAMSTDTAKIVDYGYVQNVNNPVVISEVSVNPIKEHAVTINGKTLEADDYTFDKTNHKDKWNMATYTINASNFADEGNYSVVVNSEDVNGVTAYSDVKKVNVNFTVDRTKPVVIVSGIKDGELYKADKKDVEIIPTDEGGQLSACKIVITDKDGKQLVDSIDMKGDDLLSYLEEHDNKIKLSIPSGNGIKVMAEASDCSVAEDGSVQTGETIVDNVTISTNIIDILVAEKPLVYASAGGVGGVIFIIFAVFFLVKKRRKMI